MKPIKAFIYESSADVRGAILFAQAWTGGLAFGSHNVLLITVDPEEFDQDLGGVVHELAHLLLAEVTFNCFGRLPTWLNEGLAVYSEGDLPEFQRLALDAAVANDELIGLRSLNGAFPAADTGADALVRAESEPGGLPHKHVRLGPDERAARDARRRDDVRVRLGAGLRDRLGRSGTGLAGVVGTQLEESRPAVDR